MDPRDIIVTALTPGTPFNTKERIWRSVGTLAAFCELEAGDVMALLVGDLADQVTCKPSGQEGKGILVALKANVNEAEEEADPQVIVAGGPVMNPPDDAEVELIEVAVGPDLGGEAEEEAPIVVDAALDHDEFEEALAAEIAMAEAGEGSP